MLLFFWQFSVYYKFIVIKMNVFIKLFLEIVIMRTKLCYILQGKAFFFTFHCKNMYHFSIKYDNFAVLQIRDFCFTNRLCIFFNIESPKKFCTLFLYTCYLTVQYNFHSYVLFCDFYVFNTNFYSSWSSDFQYIHKAYSFKWQQVDSNLQPLRS